MATGATIGHIEQYRPENELFSSYLERVEQFFIANDIRSDRGEAQRPKFFKPRSVPYALWEPIAEELDRLEREGIIDKVTHSEWATPLVAVPKTDGRVRLCGDFKVTVNPSLSVEQYPLPKVEDLLATLAGGTKFMKPALTQAYLQARLAPRIEEVLHDKHSPQALPIKPLAVWGNIRSRSVPKGDGYHFARNPRGNVLH